MTQSTLIKSHTKNGVAKACRLALLDISRLKMLQVYILCCKIVSNVVTAL